MKILIYSIISVLSTRACFSQVATTHETTYEEVAVVYSGAKGIGPEKGVMRRDPSDIIKVGELFYVWYSKGRRFHWTGIQSLV